MDERVTTTKEEILSTLRYNGKYLRSLGVRRLGLFGSFVRGEQKIASDIDLLVEFEQGKKTFDNFMTLSFFLETVFQRRVDLITPEAMSPYIGPHALREVEYAHLAA